VTATAKPSPSGDKARVTVFVAVDPRDAFDVFTLEIDTWWRHGKRFRGAASGHLEFRGGAGGTLVEASRDGEHVIGAVRVRDPGERLVFEWRATNFAPDESTEVEVTFTPKRGGTEVVVEHRGWSKIRADHPVRHGQDVERFIRSMGMWWGDLVSSLRERVAKRTS
jgi:uncharacterized protein YndB with AHSA1/START domain